MLRLGFPSGRSRSIVHAALLHRFRRARSLAFLEESAPFSTQSTSRSHPVWQPGTEGLSLSNDFLRVYPRNCFPVDRLASLVSNILATPLFRFREYLDNYSGNEPYLDVEMPYGEYVTHYTIQYFVGSFI